MKVLIVAKYADRRGGAEVYTEGLALNLAKRGHEVQLLCHSAAKKVKACCQVIEIQEQNFVDRVAIWRFAPLFYQRCWQRQIRRTNIPKPDAIICSLPLNSKDLSNRFATTPWVYLPHSRIAPIEATPATSESIVHRRFTAGLYARCERWSLRNADTTVRFTKGNQVELQAYYSLPPQTRFSVIPAPVEHFGERNMTDSNSRLRFVSACRLVDSKNLKWLMNQIIGLGSNRWHWTIAGDGPQKLELQHQCEQLGIQDHVTFLGFCQDTRKLYQNADLHLFPSRRESLGLVILEAMAFGVPTLAFRPDGKRYQTASDEIIENGVDGLLASGEHDYMEQLGKLVKQPALLTELGSAGKQKANSNHRWDSIADQWDRLLQQLTRPTKQRSQRLVAHA